MQGHHARGYTQQRSKKADSLPTRTMGSLGLPLLGVVNTGVLSYVSLLFIHRQAKAADNNENTSRQASYSVPNIFLSYDRPQRQT